MNSECETGFLIDISNVDISRQQTPASKLQLADDKVPRSWPLALSSASHFDGCTENSSNGQLKKPIEFLGCELLEDETFDFNDLSKSPDVSGCSDGEAIFPYLLSDVCKINESHDLKLNSEQLAEVFKEATVVAVKLENYIDEMSRTPPTSPNLTALLAERSAQRKDRLKSIEKNREQELERCREQELERRKKLEQKVEKLADRQEELELKKEIKHQPEFRNLEKDFEMEQELNQSKKDSPRAEETVVMAQAIKLCSKDGFRSPLQVPLQRQSSTLSGMTAPMLRKIPLIVNSLSASYSKALQQNKNRMSMTCPQRPGPLKATVLPAAKQLKQVERTSLAPTVSSPSIRKPQSQLSNSFVAGVYANVKKTAAPLLRTQSFNSVPKIPVRQLKRRNSVLLPTVDSTPVQADNDPRLNKRSSISGALPNQYVSTPPLRNFQATSGIPVSAAVSPARNLRQSKVPTPIAFKNSSFVDATQKLKRPKLN